MLLSLSIIEKSRGNVYVSECYMVLLNIIESRSNIFMCCYMVLLNIIESRSFVYVKMWAVFKVYHSVDVVVVIGFLLVIFNDLLTSFTTFNFNRWCLELNHCHDILLTYFILILAVVLTEADHLYLFQHTPKKIVTTTQATCNFLFIFLLFFLLFVEEEYFVNCYPWNRHIENIIRTHVFYIYYLLEPPPLFFFFPRFKILFLTETEERKKRRENLIIYICNKNIYLLISELPGSAFLRQQVRWPR
jgi:hypothetical protein